MAIPRPGEYRSLPKCSSDLSPLRSPAESLPRLPASMTYLPTRTVIGIGCGLIPFLGLHSIYGGRRTRPTSPGATVSFPMMKNSSSVNAFRQNSLIRTISSCYESNPADAAAAQLIAMDFPVSNGFVNMIQQRPYFASHRLPFHDRPTLLSEDRR
jgi:hypothetical protein